MIVASLLLSGCADTPPTHKTIARITYYSAHEDKYGSKLATGGRAREGVTCAAAPWHRFGTKVVIPRLAGLVGNGTFVVQDRGSAVTKMKASRRKTEVIDIYLAGAKRYAKRRMNELTRKVGYYTEVRFE